MRLFYIIIFLSTLVSFASFAAPKKDNTSKIQSAQPVRNFKKSTFKFHFGHTQDQESFQKDLMNHTVVKNFLVVFAVLIMALLLSITSTISKAVLKRLKHNYWCLFKMLYPKHFFW
ncbi:hypothetical protein GJU39_01565 [Pedobacter petrophilus]|uniref:Uncharacterized protein n=1 Tax=Pedobacter petrophilus TaxID=1908241 RepID=A0A7K0FTV8_9SPHI|nr:hypothetical protein [Pedobacter petrophilus]MRX74762.1 hypothetical protein [Pedobacter petrophilus]